MRTDWMTYLRQILPAMLFVSMAGSVSVRLAAQEPANLPQAEDSRYRFGLGFLLDSRRDDSEVVIPDYSADCGLLDVTSGGGWQVFGILDYLLMPGLRLQASAGFVRSVGELRHRGDLFPLRGESGAVVNGRVDQVVDYVTTGLDFTLLAAYPFSDRVSGLAGLGLWTRLHSEETHREEAVEPETLLLANNRRSMELPDRVLFDYRPVQPRLIAGLRYNLPIGGDSWLSPELRASWTPIGWLSGNGPWRTLTLSLGGSLRFGLPGGDHVIVPIPQPDTLEPPPLLIPEIRTAPEIVRVQITEYDSTEALPLLNRVFFREGSSAIPERYLLIDRRASDTFRTSQLTGPTLEVYYDVLNVIGLRMRRLDEAILTVTGYRNSFESDTTLGLRRASNIRDYLIGSWGIEPERIEIRGEGLPPNPAVERTPEGREENAMARLEATNPNVTIPIIRKYVQRIATPPSVTFFPRAISEAGIASWQIDIENVDGNHWRTLAGEGAMPPSIEWDWRSDSSTLPSIPLELSYRLVVTDSAGSFRSTDRKEIFVEMTTLQQKLLEQRQDTIIESYSLLLFDYNSPQVSPADRALVNAIAARVSPGARVRFTGYTDSLGDARLNRDLALRRAEAAAAIFREAVDFEIVVEINPDGGELERYTYLLPEGRSYDRTVIIEVRTPIRREE